MVKLIVFPFAGGNKHSFDSFFDKTIHPSVLEYPGRGTRVKEHLIADIHLLIEDMYAILLNEVNSCDQYIIYGHSMGALVGYLICKKIEENKFKKPLKLIVSGAKSPIVLRNNLLSNLPDQNFWVQVSKLGGISNELKSYPELIKYFIPILKADFQCIENFIYDNNSLKLNIPIEAFFGSDEEIVREEVEEWQKVTLAKIKITKLKGNHFFIFNHKSFFSEYFKNLEVNATI